MRLVSFLLTTAKGLFTLVGGIVVLGAAAFFIITAAGDNEMHVMLEPKAEIDPPFDIGLAPLAGEEIDSVYEAWLSPQQEAEEESDAPSAAPAVFLSTKPSVEREDRDSRGHGTVAFNRERSRAYVHLELANVDPDDIVLAHLHCGKPGQLGPIIVDFGATGDLTEYFADGVLSYEVTNADIAAGTHGHGIVGAGTAGCPILLINPADRHRTVAGMALIASQGELYFNIHTAQQTFYGDIRGQLEPVPIEVVEAVLAAG